MSRPGVVRWTILLLLAVTVAVSGGAGAADAPWIELQVNGSPVADGERVVVPSANLSTEITGNVSLNRVEIRVDGATIHEATPEGTAYRVDLDPDFHARTNDVQVVVKGEDGGLWTHQAAIYKDTLAPDIGLDSPVTVEPGYQFPGRQSREAASIQIAGVVEDAASITSFSARVVGGGRSVETTALEDGAFRLNTTLAPGNNSLIVEATDEFGNSAYRRLQFEVTDESEPSLSVREWPNRTAVETIRPTVVATDAVGIAKVRYRIPGQPRRTIVEPAASLLDRGRTNVTRRPSLTFARPGTYNVTFNVTDESGKFTETTKTVTYDPVTPAEAVAPIVRLRNRSSGLYNESRYRLDATVENGTVRVVEVEARNSRDRVTLLETVYDGPNASTVPVTLDVPIDPGRNEIEIAVTDALENVHVRTVVVDTANASAYEPPTTAPTKAASTTAPTRVPTTPQQTRLPVTTATPIGPATATQSPLSPLLSVVALALAALVVRRQE
jgi:hypothetical protein